jgi:osmotically-inducible protein OsmY
MMRVVYLSLFFLSLIVLQGCVPLVAAGVGTTGVIMAQDRRTHEAFIDDQKIEATASERINKQITGIMHVNVTSFNYKVLISGEVPDASTKEEIGKIVSGIDGLITSDVKLRFLNSKNFNPEHIKVVTEDNTVFLMGIVNHAEADVATEIARTTKGVNQVVRMFEYLD